VGKRQTDEVHVVKRKREKGTAIGQYSKSPECAGWNSLYRPEGARREGEITARPLSEKLKRVQEKETHFRARGEASAANNEGSRFAWEK